MKKAYCKYYLSYNEGQKHFRKNVKYKYWEDKGEFHVISDEGIEHVFDRGNFEMLFSASFKNNFLNRFKYKIFKLEESIEKKRKGL